MTKPTNFDAQADASILTRIPIAIGTILTGRGKCKPVEKTFKDGKFKIR
jgi:hypothetical protein